MLDIINVKTCFFLLNYMYNIYNNTINSEQ